MIALHEINIHLTTEERRVLWDFINALYTEFDGGGDAWASLLSKLQEAVMETMGGDDD